MAQLMAGEVGDNEWTTHQMNVNQHIISVTDDIKMNGKQHWNGEK